MGKVAHIIVTGASGFLGREILRVCRAKGHRVTAISRSAQGLDGDVTYLQMDLATADPATLRAACSGADAIIHAAGEMSSDPAVHAHSTLPATRNICETAQTLSIHITHVSSIAVYDYQAIDQGAFVRETSPIERHPNARDGYVAAKLGQESILAELCPNAGVLRAGALYDADRTWNAHIGPGMGPILLRLGARGHIPLCHVTRCAEAAVAAATRRISGAVNVLDADLPDRVRFVEEHAKSGWPKLVIPLPWQVFETLGAVLPFWKFRPGLLCKPVLHARMKAVGFDIALLAENFPDLSERNFASVLKEGRAHD